MEHDSPALSALRGRTALITGATRGIGRAIVERFAAHGVNVVLTARTPGAAEGVAAEISARWGVRAAGLTADVTRAADVEASVARALEIGHGRLDVLVNNAGHPVVPAWWNTPLHAVPPEGIDAWFRAVHDVDVAGARRMTRAVLPAMMQQRAGAIVFVSSTAGLAGDQATPYTEAKSAVLGLMRDVALAYGRHGIRANAVAPGDIRTGWEDGLDGAEREALARRTALDRWGEADEVADAVLFLASPMAGFITGQALVVDGGRVLR